MRYSQQGDYQQEQGRMGIKSIWQELDERTEREKKKIEGDISEQYQRGSRFRPRLRTSSSALDVNQDS